MSVSHFERYCNSEWNIVWYMGNIFGKLGLVCYYPGFNLNTFTNTIIEELYIYRSSDT